MSWLPKVVFPFLAFAGVPSVVRAEVPIQITVTTTGQAASRAYVALYGPDRPGSRPTFEAVTTTGKVTVKAPPADYQLFVEAEGYAGDQRAVRIADSAVLVAVDLLPAARISGTVTDSEGRPIAGARVSQVRAAIPWQIGLVSELASRELAKHWTATTDANGWWALSVSGHGAMPILIEAPGYEPVRRMVKPAEAAGSVDTVLQRGAALRVTLDRASSDVLIIPVRLTENGADMDRTLWDAPAWARSATEGRIEWDGLPTGAYRLLARNTDIRRFADPVELGRVTLSTGRVAELHSNLPPLSKVVTTYRSILVVAPIDAAKINAFARDVTGRVRNVRRATERVVAGSLVYLDTSAASNDLYLVDNTQLILASKDPLLLKADHSVYATVALPRAEGKLRILAEDAAAMPTHALAEFRECLRDESFSLPVNVEPDGAIIVPLPTTCRALLVRFDAYEPLVIAAVVSPREVKWLGDHKLQRAASAEVRVLREPSRTPVRAARVRALVQPPVGRSIVVADAIADAAGVAMLAGLPANREIIIEAQEEKSALSGTVRATWSPGTRGLVDPLFIPEPATLLVAPRFTDEFRGAFPDAKIDGISIEHTGGDASARRNGKLTSGEVIFTDIPPGAWQILAIVNADGTPQPIEIPSVELGPGEMRRIEPRVAPFVFVGQVTSAGEGIEVALGIGDPPGPRAITRRIRTKPDGQFTAVLPREGLYDVDVVPVAAHNEPVTVGEVTFRDPHHFIQIALPSAKIVARVVSEGRSVAGVPVTITMRRNRMGPGVAQSSRRASSDAGGEVRFNGLTEGMWALEARDESTGRSAEATAITDRNETVTVVLELAASITLAGTVRDVDGRPISRAAVRCLATTSSAIARVLNSETNSGGEFSIDLTSPAPPLLYCGVISPTGVATVFATAPTRSADFRLQMSGSFLTVTGWKDVPGRDQYWLLAADGRPLALSWIAAVLPLQGANLSIPHAPLGVWKLVRVDTVEKWIALGTGLGAALTAVADLRIEPGRPQTIRLGP